MLRKTLANALVALALLGIQFNAIAGTNGTSDEAKAMVERAVALMSSQGNDKAYVAFNENPGPFVDRDLYVFVLDLDGNTLAHGGNKAMIGKSLINLKDSSGKAFVQEMLELAKAKGEGWIDYDWPNPLSKKIERKSTFVRKVGSTVVGVGAYKFLMPSNRFSARCHGAASIRVVETTGGKCSIH
jgi:cytochrome c